jgi:hypothetical protein
MRDVSRGDGKGARRGEVAAAAAASIKLILGSGLRRPTPDDLARALCDKEEEEEEEEECGERSASIASMT